MPNMSYCQFENTYQDLRQCYEAMDDESGRITEMIYPYGLYDHKPIFEFININELVEHLRS